MSKPNKPGENGNNAMVLSQKDQNSIEMSPCFEVDLNESLSASLLLGIKQVVMSALEESVPLDIHTVCIFAQTCELINSVIQLF